MWLIGTYIPSGSTDDDVKTYIRENYITEISDDDLNSILELYPSDPAAGSPFDTGSLNAITPQFKRLGEPVFTHIVGV